MDLKERETVVVAPAENFISLSVVRSLGRQGLRVVAVTQRDGIGAASRYVDAVIRAEVGDAALVEAVKGAIRQYRPAALNPAGYPSSPPACLRGRHRARRGELLGSTAEVSLPWMSLGPSGAPGTRDGRDLPVFLESLAKAGRPQDGSEQRVGRLLGVVLRQLAEKGHVRQRLIHLTC